MTSLKMTQPIPPVFSTTRRCGNTIRIVDYLIQLLFINGECTCYDHYRNPDQPRVGREMRKLVMRYVLRRLANEHDLTPQNFLIVDYDQFHIKLKEI